MLSKSILGSVRTLRASILNSRNIGATATLQANDPIQQLFLDKIKEYKQKSSGGKLVDPTPEIEREMKQELEKLEKMFGGGSGIDMTQFPAFKFDDPKIDPINMDTSAAK